MFLVREFAACVMFAVVLASLLVLVCGTGYMLRLTGIMCLRTWRTARFRRATLKAAAMRLSSLVTVVSLLVLSPRAHTQQAKPAPPPDAPFTINVSVDEVVLHATVRNRKGTPVAGLGREAFQVFEDGTPQSIKHFSREDVPVTVGLVIDNSGSMWLKRAEVVAAALAFAASSNPQDQMFLVNFNERVSFGLPADVPFTDQPDQLRVAMRSVISDGKTALYDAVAVALEHLKEGNRDKRVLIVVSDGADNASTHTRAQMLDLATRSNAIIYTLGIYEPADPENRNPEVMHALAKASGGEAYFPKELRQVRPICERIAHEIRNQYTISYIPTNQKQDGTYRSIQVRAAAGEGRGLSVTTRAGYIAPLTPASTPKSEARN